MAPERVYLHIGAPKTGTSYLQMLLAANRAALKADGILYPGTRGDAHHTAAWDLRGTPPQRQGAGGIEGSWDKLVGRANAWTGEAVVVSSELFVYCTDKQIDTALAAFEAEVHVVYTARDLLRQVPAVWQERVKNQQTMSYPDFVAAVRSGKGGGRGFWRAQDAPAVIERWSRGLRPAQVHVVPAPPPAAPPTTLWNRFTSVFGRRGDAFQTEVGGSANTSMTMVQTELLRRYNARHGAALPWTVYRRTIRAEVDRSFPAAVSDRRKLTLPSADRRFFEAAALKAFEGLQRSGYAVAGDLDDLVPAPLPASPPTQSSEDHIGVVSDGEVVVAALDVVHSLMTRQEGERAKRREQRRARRRTGGS